MPADDGADSQPTFPSHIEQTVQAIARLHDAHEQRATRLQRLVDRLTALVASCKSVRLTLGIYDSAYQQLTQQSDPAAFRDFLLRAPTLFNELGERLGAIEHIVSFWRFRFPAGRRPMVTPAELASVFTDFESSLGADHVSAPGILPKPQMIGAA